MDESFGPDDGHDADPLASAHDASATSHTWHDDGPPDIFASADEFLASTILGDDWSPDPQIVTEPLHLGAALDAAVERSGFQPGLDIASQGWLNDLQGLTTEFLVADALNHRGDGLTYHLYSDPSHPDVDIAGLTADGQIAKLIQVKATDDGTYASTGFHPGVELVTTRDGYTEGAIPLDITAVGLRAQIQEMLDSSGFSA